MRERDPRGQDRQEQGRGGGYDTLYPRPEEANPRYLHSPLSNVKHLSKPCLEKIRTNKFRQVILTQNQSNVRREDHTRGRPRQRAGSRDNRARSRSQPNQGYDSRAQLEGVRDRERERARSEGAVGDMRYGRSGGGSWGFAAGGMFRLL